MLDDDDSSFEGVPIGHIVTEATMTKTGLSLFYKEVRIKRAKKKDVTNSKRFLRKFGVKPVTACQIYEDMQQTTIEKARVVGNEKQLKFFLMALYYLRKYPEEDDLESTFDYSKKYIADKCWRFVGKIQALKEEKIVFPKDEELNNDIWLMSVDGTHVWINEPPHEEFSKDREAFSHKYNHAGMNYELGISLTGGLIWMNGPFKAGRNDISIFREEGLMGKLQAIGKMAIGDMGYRGEPLLVSFFNTQDDDGVAKFKARAQMRHETFNGKTKVFKVLQGRFRHSEGKLASAFEAVCVLCQYKLEVELPLFDILIEDVVNKMDDGWEDLDTDDEISSDEDDD